MKPRDPFRSSVVTSAVLIAAGFIAIAVGKRVVARTLLVYVQIPAIISGGLVGLALILTGCVLLVVQTSRRLEARARAEQEATLDVLASVVTALKERPEPKPARKRRSA